MYKKIAGILGILAACGTIVLWIMLHFYNPYTREPADPDAIISTLLTLVLPACLAIAAILAQKPYLMFISFIWSLPVGLIYMGMTPSIFKWFTAASILYLISALHMLWHIKGRSMR